MATLELNSLWKTILGELEVELGHNNFKLYFKNSSLLDLAGNIAKIGFPNRAMADQANFRYYSLVQTVFEKHSGVPNPSLLFEVSATPKPSPSEDEVGPLFVIPKIDQSAVAEAIKKSHLRPDFTLEEFCVSTSNQLAFAAAQAVAKDPGKNYNPFFIWGGVGVGKTHLMQAVGHEILRRDPSTRVIYASGEQFTNEIIQGIRHQNTHDFKEKYRSADALLIDDVQFLSGKDTAQEEYFHTFNAIHQRQGQIIMTSDTKPSAIKDLTDRLRSRFEGGLVADISTPDSELKTAVCLLKFRKRGMELSTSLASLISSSVDNIRSLDGAIQILITKSTSSGLPITPEFIASTLSLPPDSLPPTVRLDARAVLDEICKFYEIPMKLIKSDRRDKPIAQPRQILMFLLKKHTEMTLDEIASFIGGRDHTTIMHGVKKIELLSESNPQVQKDLLSLRTHLGV